MSRRLREHVRRLILQYGQAVAKQVVHRLLPRREHLVQLPPLLPIGSFVRLRSPRVVGVGINFLEMRHQQLPLLMRGVDVAQHRLGELARRHVIDARRDGRRDHRTITTTQTVRRRPR